MSKLLSFFIICAAVSAKVDSTWWETESQALFTRYFKENTRNEENYGLDLLADLETDRKNKALAQERVEFLQLFLNSEIFDDYTFRGILGAGGYGMVFGGKHHQMFHDEQISLKAMWESSTKDTEADNSYGMYKALADAGVPYLVKMEKPKCGQNVKRGLVVCGILMDRALPVTEPMFSSAPTDEKRLKNTLHFIKFMANTLYAFQEMHFTAGYLHGDIKPPNLMYAINAAGEPEPRVIDFDLTFNRAKKANPGFLTYTPDYRPPELLAIVADNNVSSRAWKILNAYVYSSEYKEDAYALGKTLLQVLKVNQQLLRVGSTRVESLKSILTRMMSRDVSTRLNTKQAYEEVLQLDLTRQDSVEKAGKGKKII